LSNPNISNPVANPTSTTNYIVTVTDANGCVNTAPTSVTVNPLPVITVNSPTICTGANAQLNASGGTTYVWSPATGLSNPNIANPVANPTSTTSYTVTVTDANGCVNTAPTSVTVNPLPVVTVNSPTICTGANAQLNATGGTTYQWSPTIGLSNPNISNPVANPTSTTNYIVTVTDANGCVNSAPTAVTVNPLPVVTVNSPTICTGATAQLNASGGTTYAWSPATGLSNPNISNPLANPTSTTNYTVTVTNANGCVNTAPTSVTVNPLPVVTVNSPTICTGANAQLNATGGTTYQWSPVTGLSNANISNPVANPTSTTNYTVTVTDANGCVNTAPASVIVNPLPVVTVNNPTICTGATAQLNASGGTAYLWLPATGLSNPNIANPLANPTTTTNYTVTVTDANGCINTAPASVTVNPLPVITVNSPTICTGANAQLNASGGTTYLWSPATSLSNPNISNPVANPTSTTNYIVTVTDANGCVNTAPTSVTVNPLPVITVNSPTICTGATVQLNATGGTTYQWLPATGLSNPNIANPVANPTSTTTYTVTVTDANGCVNTAPAAVTVNPLPVVTVNSPTICTGTSAQLNASGGTNYLWSPATGLSNPNIANPVANPISTTNYIVTVTDANGCINTAPTSVTVNPLPVVTVNSPTICTGANAQLNASGGTTYVWSPATGLSNPNIANPVANPTSTTNYIVTVTDANGCVNTAPASVTVNPLPVVTVNSPTICTGATAQLNATGGTTYVWSPTTGLSNPNIANPVANPTSTTSYTVTVTDANGCVNTALASVTVNPLPAVTVNSPTICTGATAQLNATGGTTYVWSPATGLSNPNIANPVANPTSTTTYTVTVTDANGCINTAPTSVTVNPLPVVTVNSPTICTGANAQLNATGGTTYLWSPSTGLSNPNIANPTANPTSTTNYTVTVTNANGCVNTAPASVIVNPLPVVTVNSPTICTGANAQLNASGGTTYVWSPATGLSNPNIANPVANPTSTTNYTVTVTDANGCVNTAPASVTVNPLPVVTVNSPTICTGTSVQLSATGGSTYLWSPATGLSNPNISNPVANPLTTTSYTVTVTNTNGCVNTAPTSVFVNALLVVTVNSPVICNGSTAQLSASGGIIYTWTPSTGLSNPYIANPLANVATTTNYTVSVTDINGCRNSVPTTVTVNPLPVVSVNSATICSGHNAQLSASGGTAYSWSPAMGLSNSNIANPIANPTITTNYSVTVTDANGCRNSAPTSVTVNPLPVISVNSPTICMGTTVQLSASGGTIYSWSPATGLNNPNIANPLASPASTTNYTVTVTNANGCVNTAPTTVSVNALLSVTVNSPVMCAGATAQLSASGGTIYSWTPATGLSNPNISSPVANPTTTTNYTVYVTDANGCHNSAPTSITVNPLPVISVNSPTICAGTNTQLIASGGTNYLWSPAAGLSNPNIANPIANPTSTTNYTVTVTNIFGCSNTSPTSVTVNPLPVISVNSPTICTGTNVQLSASGGITYSWSPATGLSNPNIANPIANPITTTNYTVTVTNANGCVNSAPTSVSVNALLAVTVNSPVICAGSTAQLNASGGTIYSWTPATGLSNPNIANPLANPATTTNYTVYVTDANGCHNSAPTSVTVNPLPVVSVNSPTICTGANAQLNATGGTSYLWSPTSGLSNPNISNPIANPTSTSTYTVTVTDANGCVNSAPTSVTVNPLPVITVNNPTICTGTSTQLNATGGTTYLWSPAIGLSNPNIANPVANPTSTTSYTVTVTDANGCVNTAPTSITVNPLPVVSVNSPTICAGTNAQLSATGGTTYSWSPAFGLNNPNIATPTAHPTTTTNYTVTVTNSNGCVNIASTAVNVNPLPVISVNSPTICTGTSVQLSASGGTMYSWSPPAGLSNPNIANPMATVTSTTNYTVTVTNANGCVNTAPTSVYVNALLVVAINHPVICNGSAAQLSASGGTIYTWTPATGLNNPYISNPIANISTTTNYTVSVTDANGCHNTVPASVTVNPVPVALVNSATICSGHNAQLSANGGTTYSWSPAIGLNNPNIANPIANPTTTTNYIVTVTNSYGCSNTAPALVTVNPVPVISVNSPSFCKGASAQLIASGGTTYSWSPVMGLSNPNIANPIASPTSTTNYTVTVTNSFGCSNSAPTSVTVNPLPVITVNSPTICNGSTAQMSATGGTTYLWSPVNGLSNPNIANPIANPTSTTNYTVAVTNSFGCNNTAPASVTVNPLPVISVNSPTICAGASALLIATGGATYSWSPATGLSNPNIANPIANPSSTTNYTVTVTGANGCKNTAPASVTVNSLPVVTVNQPTICFGATAQLSASGGTIYSWTPSAGLSNPNIANPMANPIITSSYTVMVTDANGCKNKAATMVHVNTLPVVTVNQPTICAGANAQLSATGGTIYSWTPASGLNNPNIANPVANPTITSSYTVIVTNANGCSNKGVALVKVNPLPVITVNQPSICIGAHAQLNATGGTTYLWTPSTGLSNPNIANPLADPTATTTYTVKVTDSKGCTNTAPAKVTVNPLPMIVAPNAAICYGQYAQLSASGGVNYTWSPSAGLSNIHIPNPLATIINTSSYTVAVMDSNGCVNKASVKVTVNPLPHLTVCHDTALCAGDSVRLKAIAIGSSATYSWIPSTGLDNASVANPLARPNSTITYTVEVTDVNGCTASKPVTIIIHPLPVAKVGPDQNICLGQQIKLHAEGGDTYSWSPPKGLSNTHIADPLASPDTTTLYTVRVTTGSTCKSAADSVTVTVYPIPTVSAGSDTTIQAGTSVTLHGSGTGITLKWYYSPTLSCLSCADPVADPMITTAYVITTVNNYGCRVTDTVVVNIEDILTLFVPSAFTPRNHDDKNNIFYAYGVGIYRFEFYIFNRWGQQIFESHDQYVGWDGTYLGVPAQQDVYVWLAKATSITGKSISKTGTVTIVY